nr:hypothetical protein [Tanacetum cinerariifolium]
SKGESLCWGRWVEVVGAVWRWWSGVENGGEVVLQLAGKPVDRDEQYMLFKRGRDDYCVGFGGFYTVSPWGY